jgi:hypothetical protein
MSDFLIRTAIGVIVGIGLGAVLGKILLGDPALGVGLGVVAGAAIGLSFAIGSR